MSNKVIFLYISYIVNILLLLFGILFMVYSVDFFSNKEYYCDNLYFFGIVLLIYSLIVILLKDCKIFTLIITISLFIYSISNIVLIQCKLKNYIFNIYISVIIFIAINIILIIKSYFQKDKEYENIDN